MVFTRACCDRGFDAKKGLKIYSSRCDLKRTQVNTEIPIERKNNIEVFLPPIKDKNLSYYLENFNQDNNLELLTWELKSR